MGGPGAPAAGVWPQRDPPEEAKNLCAVSVGGAAGRDAHHPGSGRHRFAWPFFLPTAARRQGQ